MKKVFAVALAMTVAVGMLAGCGSNDSAQGGAADGTITVVSREDGSGTRGAFIELFGKKTTQVKKSTTPQTQRKSQTAQPL